MQFTQSVRNETQTRRYSIATTDSGWEVREERNGEVVTRLQYQDWHRVERARRMIVGEVEALRSQGWSLESQSPITNKSSITQ
jgi:hypothetical protein